MCCDTESKVFGQVSSPETVSDYGHFEQRLADGSVRGVYDVLLPDGRHQVVQYTADKSGFHPTVSYIE